MKLIITTLLLSLLLTSNMISAQPGSTREERVKWFTDARFGMFIHWGLYSGAEGIWKGERLRNGNNYAEWIRYRNRISREEYGTLTSRFNWNKINPEEWVLLAKKAGMKYIIITAKHHDGVAIWNSKISDYNLSKLCNTDRDVIKELSSACRKHGIKLAFYYSHWLDWEHPYGWDHNQEITGKVTDEQYNRYWQEKVLPQLRELLTNYGDIAMLWFDMWVDHKTTIVKKEQLEQVIKLIRELQPNCLINSRLGLTVSNTDIDFETMGDNQFGAYYQNYAWETSGTIAHSWGYNALENQWKSTSQLLQSLIDNVSLNGGFTLNIGPRADGSVPYEGIRRLNDMGTWLSKQGESIYGSSGLPLRPGQNDWGRITTKKIDASRQSVFLQVYNWPLDHVLRLTGILSAPQRIELITQAGKLPLKFSQNGPLTHIQLPDNPGNPFVSTIVVHYAQPLNLDAQVVAESSFGGFSLNGRNNSDSSSKYELKPYDGVRPAHFVIDKPGQLTWKFYAPEAGKYKFDLSFHNAARNDIECTVTVLDQTLHQQLKPSGQVVVEPHDYNTDEFVNTRMGNIDIPKKGYYELTIRFNPKARETLFFNSIWINKAEK
ncbi:alpha-L-fucosidase [Pseudobacter ginsenosidimutans]|uniref:alpha-L-fucosidase n=1 Tax=Pseudobacter ginsenosidimutans TaxID=661488 RepID=A0A4Q7N5J0_9BACT|nr:alpha-L-fucosidase [Pseudobacter ginsenosidimutans]QEC44826.1 alpha-L-fucosidase [Pseudobacter ginsenosidimutans]RZS76316.1 alpha-L-fucosidase [Pseudobacter ginsenosidimutans]